MIGSFGRRVIDLSVFFFAAYAFAFVPLGNRTALEHCRAILRTRAAREAGRDVITAADRLRRRLLASDDEPVRGRGTPVLPALPGKAKAPAEAVMVPASYDRPDASLQ